jgi:hypothetical protein
MSGVFAASFGFVEATVVVYLRAAAGLLPGYRGTVVGCCPLLGEVLSSVTNHRRVTPESSHPRSAPRGRDNPRAPQRSAPGFCKAQIAGSYFPLDIWDIAYYGRLWATVKWPLSLREPDVLFLIPIPWLSPVWFPLLVSALTLLAVLLTRVRLPKAN